MIYGIIVKISEVLLRIKYDEIDKINELIEQFVDSVNMKHCEKSSLSYS